MSKVAKSLTDPSPGKTEKRCDSCQAWNSYDAERCLDCGVHFNKRRRKGVEGEAPSSDGRCDWNVNGKRCHYPAAVSGATNGSGSWYCSLHADCHDARVGEDYVRASADYRPYGKAEREEAHQAKVTAWLTERGLLGGHTESMDHLHKLTKSVQTHSKGVNADWARKILARRDAGETMPSISVEKAELALRIRHE